MSLGFVKKDERHYYVNTIAATGFASAALLFGQGDLARSAVFEQMDNGTVVQIDGGVSSDTPPSSTKDDELFRNYTESATGSSPAVVAGYPTRERPDPVRSTGAVLVDMPSSARMPRQQLRQPSPRTLSAMFSSQQREMRELTAEIGRSYAHQPGVIRARLDERAFVDLFTAMIHQESNFNPRAVSPAGAAGLGQLMPQTARDLGVCDIFSARDNLDGAARYLTSMLDQFGSPELALAAYNAGPGAVKKYGGVPPYRETNQYVANIVGALGRNPDPEGQFLAYGDDASPSPEAAEASIMAHFEIDEAKPRTMTDCRQSP
jgi:hypothetical protein